MEGNVQICFNLINEYWILCKIHAKIVFEMIHVPGLRIWNKEGHHMKRGHSTGFSAHAFQFSKTKRAPKCMILLLGKGKKGSAVCRRRVTINRNWVQVGPNRGKNKIMNHYTVWTWAASLLGKNWLHRTFMIRQTDIYILFHVVTVHFISYQKVCAYLK